MWSFPLSSLRKSLTHASIKWRLDSGNVKRQHGLWIFVILRPKCCIRTQVHSLNTFVQNNPVDRVSSKLPGCVSFLFLTLNLIWNWWHGAVHKWLHHFFVRVNGEKNYFATKQRKLGRWWLSSQFKCSLCVKVWYDLWNVFKIGGLPKISAKRRYFVMSVLGCRTFGNTRLSKKNIGQRGACAHVVEIYRKNEAHVPLLNWRNPNHQTMWMWSDCGIFQGGFRHIFPFPTSFSLF